MWGIPNILIKTTEEKNNLKTNQFTARIKSSKNMETSKVFIGEKLLAHKNKFQNFKKNTFFYSDLEGCNVIDLNKKSIQRQQAVKPYSHYETNITEL